MRRRTGNPDRNDLERLILMMGWQLRAKKGGHPVYVRPGRLPITLPGHRNDLNRITVMKILNRLEEELVREEEELGES